MLVEANDVLLVTRPLRAPVEYCLDPPYPPLLRWLADAKVVGTGYAKPDGLLTTPDRYRELIGQERLDVVGVYRFGEPDVSSTTAVGRSGSETDPPRDTTDGAVDRPTVLP